MKGFFENGLEKCGGLSAVIFEDCVLNHENAFKFINFLKTIRHIKSLIFWMRTFHHCVGGQELDFLEKNNYLKTLEVTFQHRKLLPESLNYLQNNKSIENLTLAFGESHRHSDADHALIHDDIALDKIIVWSICMLLSRKW